MGRGDTGRVKSENNVKEPDFAKPTGWVDVRAEFLGKILGL